MQLALRDRSTTGQPAMQALLLNWQESVPLTPRTLISERVRIEWEAREQARDAAARKTPRPLVDLDMMRRLNPYRKSHEREPAPPARTPATLGSVTALALDGFVRNAFFLIVDGRQVTELDETIPFRPTSEVTFVRLVPLVGG